MFEAFITLISNTLLYDGFSPEPTSELALFGCILVAGGAIWLVVSLCVSYLESKKGYLVEIGDSVCYALRMIWNVLLPILRSIDLSLGWVVDVGAPALFYGIQDFRELLLSGAKAVTRNCYFTILRIRDSIQAIFFFLPHHWERNDEEAFLQDTQVNPNFAMHIVDLPPAPVIFVESDLDIARRQSLEAQRARQRLQKQMADEALKNRLEYEQIVREQDAKWAEEKRLAKIAEAGRRPSPWTRPSPSPMTRRPTPTWSSPLPTLPRNLTQPSPAAVFTPPPAEAIMVPSYDLATGIPYLDSSTGNFISNSVPASEMTPLHWYAISIANEQITQFALQQANAFAAASSPVWSHPPPPVVAPAPIQPVQLSFEQPVYVPVSFPSDFFAPPPAPATITPAPIPLPTPIETPFPTIAEPLLVTPTPAIPIPLVASSPPPELATPPSQLATPPTPPSTTPPPKAPIGYSWNNDFEDDDDPQDGYSKKYFEDQEDRFSEEQLLLGELSAEKLAEADRLANLVPLWAR
ncbi:hypothetical protein RQP46_008391 [Phenoliferia psychrophenolica]